MKTFKIILALHLALFSASVSLSQNVPRRFLYPLDKEAEMFSLPKASFDGHIPVYPSLWPNINISRDSFPQNEPSVKISRKDPGRIVAAWRDFRRGVSNPTNRQVGYSYSTNRGATWSVSTLLDSTLLPGFPRNSDPVVAVDTAGNFYIAVVCIGNSGGLGVYKSTDGGVTFPNAYLVANSGSEDKEWMESDRVPGSPFINNLYMSWTRFSGNTGIKLATSSNAGLSWTDAVSVSDQISGVQGSDIAVGLNGEIYVTWLDVNSSDDVIKFDKSTNAGASFGTDVNIAGGPTPNIPISSSNVTFPSIAADITDGPRRGYIYVVWCDARNGDPDIFLTRSTNRGVNWSSPVRVNNDPVGNGKLQCWPWIEVDDKGNIAILYYSSQNTSANNIIEAYYAWSINGGDSFFCDKLSLQPSPTNQPNTAVRFGDYICLDYYDDNVMPVWTDERAGGVNMEIYTASIITPSGVSSYSVNVPAGHDLQQNFPNPFNPATKIRFGLKNSEHIKLSVFDVLGKEIAVLAEGPMKAGEYEVTFNAEGLNAGVYFYRMTAGAFSGTKKLVVVK
jgi:hypothetical protein